MKRIYVAGPISHGDQARNVAKAMNAASRLIEAGYVPFLPHLFHFLHMHHPQDYETWMALDFEWLDQCEALVRLSGHSPGADREVTRALDQGLPVFHGVEAFFAAERQRLAV